MSLANRNISSALYNIRISLYGSKPPFHGPRHIVYTNEPSKVDISNYMHTYKERGSKMENTSLHGFEDFSDSILMQYIPNQ